ncbi:MAG: hypothetical protein L0M06_14425 [Enterococcus sp.]|uniref:SpaA isopeptide-forming pilin-related protein n=1 Tax=Enterococcus sp. TaxID=35783 RepID=UPI002648F5F0|nr:SpaA isopeptide-forming pilin-related protein [Enterococcus sp.]MDN6003122.1 hypothetical protein [Enterococcus sp.]MDN6561352.1 hypothetical protein [Enterococcus sp.]MDN6777744.1 hypothetical protein [Enterococcus sp.]
MPEMKRIKQIVAVLLPILFLVGIVSSFSKGKILKADDSFQPLAQVKLAGNLETKTNVIVQEEEVPVELIGKETRLVRLPDSPDYAVYQTDKAGNPLMMEEKSQTELADLMANQEETLAKNNETTETANSAVSDASVETNLEAENSAVFHVTTGKEKGSTYIQLVKGQSVHLTIRKQTDNEKTLQLIDGNDATIKQNLFKYGEKKDDVVSESTDTNSTIDQLTKETYTNKDSFKPIEMPLQSKAQRRAAKPAVGPIAVTDVKTTIKTGTAKFDTKDTPGYDSSADNDIVRSFDSITYLLSFSLEASNSDITYTDIKYRVDMELPDAYALDSHGKQRFNAEVVDNEHGELVETSSTTKLSKGFVESTIGSNGQIFLPIIVNTYGAENGAKITPNVKITILSAKNEQSGEVEEVNETYDKSNYTSLNLKETTVSALPSVKPNLILGGRTLLGNVAPSSGTSNNYEAVSVGMTLALAPIDGRTTDDFKGATFPNGEIKVTLDNSSYYQKDGAGGARTQVPTVSKLGSTDYSKETAPTAIIASTISAKNPSSWNKALYVSDSLKIPTNFTEINVPNGKSEQIHVVEPSVSLEKKKTIGVYNSGRTTVQSTGSDLTMRVTNSDYTPIYNPYTYTLKGEKTNNNEKLFSSSTLLLRWPKAYLNRKGTGLYSTDVKVGSISYEGQTKKNYNPSVTISDALKLAGPWINSSTFTKEVRPGSFVGLSSTKAWNYSAGDATVGKGEKNIYVGGATVIADSRVQQIHNYIRWNANSFEYDLDRDLYAPGDMFEKSKFRFGVGKTKDYPTLKHDTQKNVDGQYTWYTTPEQAAQKGKISAVKLVSRKGSIDFSFWAGAPIKVIGNTGQNDKFGHSNATIYDGYFYDSTNAYLGTYPDLNSTYTPSTYDSTGKATKPTKNDLGDSMFIKPFKIETTTTPEKATYKTNENIKWKVQGHLLGTENTTYASKIQTTLPKGIQYTKGSSVDGQGKPLPEPQIINESNGSTRLVWSFSNITPSKGNTIEINFESTAVTKDLTFNNYSLAEANVSSIAELWLQSDPNQKDTSAGATRSSYAKVTLYQMQQVLITKKEDKPAIEVGEKNPVKTDNAITYTMDIKNDSVEDMNDVRLADILPYNGDSRGSKFNGSITVEDIKASSTSKATISYSKQSVDDKADILGIKDGVPYTPGETAIEDIKDAKVVWVDMPTLKVGEKVTLTVKIRPTGQKAGDVYVNNAGLDSKLKLPVKSQNVKTTVYSRDLSGVAWYDDKADGLIGNGSTGAPEEFIKDVPVKLYRTSLVDKTYVDQPVEESLTGQKFIDDEGKSLIKTDANGKYLFENLPEGDYVVAFEVDDKTYTVTKKLVGDDPTINSKANLDTYKTDAYTQPILSDLAKGKETIHHLPDLNIGLIRAAASIRLFKYEAGTAVDANKDGELSDAEKATGTPLPGAVFELYSGDKEEKIGSATTDSTGVIRFDNLLPGEYTLVETEAPEGFELMKKPIKVTITEVNQTIQLYQDNDKQTELPHAGGANPILIGLIASATLLIVGAFVVMFYFRNPKQGGSL